MRERRALLISSRRSFWRARFFDWGVFAMVISHFSGQLQLLSHNKTRSPEHRNVSG